MRMVLLYGLIFRKDNDYTKIDKMFTFNIFEKNFGTLWEVLDVQGVGPGFEEANLLLVDGISNFLLVDDESILILLEG